MQRRRVVVTGLGVVAPNGTGKDEFWKALVSGKSGLRNSSAGEFNLPCKVVGEAHGFDANSFIEPKDARRMSRISQFAVACAKMALADSKLDIASVDRRRVGTCFGTTIGDADFDETYQRFLAKRPRAIGPTMWSEFPPHAPTSHVANELDIQGPALTCSAGCSTGLMAIDWAAHQITSNIVDIVVAGSGDTLLSPVFISGLDAGDLLTKESDPSRASRPYDLHRDGLVPSEAAGVVILESLESAVDRQASIYAEYLGYGCGVDSSRVGNHLNGQGLADAIKSALIAAELLPDQIDCINAHGLSHPVFDLVETNGFKLAFDEIIYRVPISSIKSMIGASFSGDGVLQTIASCLILRDGVIPPTVNLENPDPRCDLDYVPNRSRVARVRHLLTNTRAIGGVNSVLILGRDR